MNIFKYPLEVTDVQTIQIPQGATILTVQVQYDKPCIWALVDPNEPVESRQIEIYGTGQQLDEDVRRRYIGTFQLRGGALIFHVFEPIKLGFTM